MRYLYALFLFLISCDPAEATNLPHPNAAAINAEVTSVFDKIEAAQNVFFKIKGRACFHPYRGYSDACTADADCDVTVDAEGFQTSTYRGTCEYRRRPIQLLPAPTKRDGVTAVKPELDKKTPKDRLFGMRDLGFLDVVKHHADYIVDDYFTPDRGGPRNGFLIHAEVEIAGRTWRRTRQVGPEDRGFVDSPTSWYRVDDAAAAAAELRVSFRQVDCPAIDHWELRSQLGYDERIDAPCADTIVSRAPLPAPGLHRFTLYALARGLESAPSNTVEVLIP